MLTIGSLFTGYGGLCELATAPLLGGQVVWHCENNPAASRVLAHHWPDVPNLSDITAVDWAAVEQVDVLTAGFPCQDISDAGRRAGIEGTRSGLWRHVADAVRTIRPQLVVLENVSALLVRGMGRVAADLAESGYDLRWCCLRAADVGAPHRRQRWFGLAYPAAQPDGAAGGPAGLGRHPLQGTELAGRPAVQSGRRGGRGGAAGAVAAADASGQRLEGDHQPHAGQRPAQGKPALGSVADGRDPGEGLEWGPFQPAIRRWEAILGRDCPMPHIIGPRSGRPMLAPVFTEWLMGLPEGHVTGVPGVTRSDQLRVLGNGVVPQQGQAALRWLLDAGLPAIA